MNLEQILNSNMQAQANYLFEPRFINLEYLFYQFYLFLRKIGIIGGGSYSGNSSGSSGNTNGNNISDSSAGSSLFDSFLGFLEILFYILLVLFVLLISYIIVRMYELRKREGMYLESEMKKYQEKMQEKEKSSMSNSKNPRWNAVVDYMKNDNQNDWKLAILEADTILDSLLDSLGFEGESVGDKLKKADPVKFKNLNTVWEAHNIRNRVAHEGSDFEISKNEANRVIYIYEQVFRDYNYI